MFLMHTQIFLTTKQTFMALSLRIMRLMIMLSSIISILACNQNTPAASTEKLASGTYGRLSNDVYILGIKTKHLNSEYGVNNIRLHGHASGGNHSIGIPAITHLKTGSNSAYIRLQKNVSATSTLSKPSTANGLATQNTAYAEIYLTIFNQKEQIRHRLPLILIEQDPVSGKFTAIKPKHNNKQNNTFHKVSIGNINPLSPDPSQNKFAGFAIEFNINDHFLPQPYKDAKTITQIDEKLIIKVQEKYKKLHQVLANKDADTWLNEYQKPWRHAALSADYGLTALDYGKKNLKLLTSNNDLRIKPLDFSQSILRIEGDNNLIGYWPPVLQATTEQLDISYPVYLMTLDGEHFEIGR